MELERLRAEYDLAVESSRSREDELFRRHETHEAELISRRAELDGLREQYETERRQGLDEIEKQRQTLVYQGSSGTFL